MERYLIWYVLSLKNYLKKRSSYLTILGMIVLIWLISGISTPDSLNMKTGLYCGMSSVAHQIKDSLVAEESDFEFVIYEEEETLIQDVIQGKIDCGFVFAEDFDKMFECRDTVDGITYYKTPFSTKGEVLKEKIFASYFELYSRNILEDAETDVFGNKNPERLEELLEKNELYLEGNAVFHLEIETWKDIQTEAKQNKDKLSMNGFVALAVFLIMFLSYAETQLSESDRVGLALSRREQLIYQFIKMQAAAILPSILGIVLIWNLGFGANVFYEILRFGVFLLLSGLWISIVGSRLSRAEDLPMWLLSIIVIHILVCPIFYDFSLYIPAIKWIRNLLPLGIYYML